MQWSLAILEFFVPKTWGVQRLQIRALPKTVISITPPHSVCFHHRHGRLSCHVQSVTKRRSVIAVSNTVSKVRPREINHTSDSSTQKWFNLYCCSSGASFNSISSLYSFSLACERSEIVFWTDWHEAPQGQKTVTHYEWLCRRYGCQQVGKRVFWMLDDLSILILS